MYENDNVYLSVPSAAKSVIWRIFGQGESPLIRKTSFDLIEPIVRKHIREDDQAPLISEIADRFEIQGDQRWLKKEMRAPGRRPDPGRGSRYSVISE